jgi:hypothetical protein
MSEYIPIGHYAVQDSRQGSGWSYYSAPSWFVQGLQEYDAIYHTTDTNRTDTAARLMRSARRNEGRFACCAKGIDVGTSTMAARPSWPFSHQPMEKVSTNGFCAAISEEAKKARTRKMIRELRSLGYCIELAPPALMT